VGVRYYNPVTGRYINRDPAGYVDGPNPYLYVHNNPINDIDPLGLWDLLDVVQGGLSAASFVPGLNIATSGLNAGISAARGNWGEAAANLAGMIPGEKILAGAVKLGKAGLDAYKDARAAVTVEKSFTDSAKAAELANAAKQDAALAKEAKDSANAAQNGAKDDARAAQLKDNAADGARRHDETVAELKDTNPESSVQREQYLRDKDGKIARDPVTGEARRIDTVVIKDEKAVDSVETTSRTADKTEQVQKENRIREAGGTNVRDRDTGKLVDFKDVPTRLDRRE